MNECKACGTTRYGYTDGKHVIFICFRCGSFDGMSGGDKDFIDEIKDNPEVLLMMIKNNIFKPMS